MEALSIIEQFMDTDEGGPAPLRPQFITMPLVPDFANVHGTRVELAIAGGMPRDLSNTCGGLMPRHRTAVLRYIGDMVRYAVAIGCADEDLIGTVQRNSAVGQKATKERSEALERELNHGH
jgi:hypothetical protein